MGTAPDESSLRAALDDIRSLQERQLRIIEALESRIAAIAEDVRRSAETVTRLKLMGDNAKRLSLAHGETLKDIEARLARFESGE